MLFRQDWSLTPKPNYRSQRYSKYRNCCCPLFCRHKSTAARMASAGGPAYHVLDPAVEIPDPNLTHPGSRFLCPAPMVAQEWLGRRLSPELDLSATDQDRDWKAFPVDPDRRRIARNIF